MSGSLIEKLHQVKKDFLVELEKTDKVAALGELKARYTGKTGPITEVLKGLKNASPEEKRSLGPVANEVKEFVLEKILEKINELEYQEINSRLKQDYFDPSAREALFYNSFTHGGLHPVTQVQREIEDIFLSMGFEILDGPHIEDEYHNFEALNIPGDHPARDMQDTFWFRMGENVQRKFLLRTHTSTVQVRGMESKKPPFKFIAPGKVFRCERTDASHEMVFHQLEGMMVGEDISVSNLIYFMKTLLSEIFRKEMEVRLRPGFFPFVEPGFELDIKCLICQGKGCSVCKQVGWLELLPCGMVHPNVLKAGGIDPTKFNGFAFGLGLDRLVMMRYAIEDIRHLHSGDLRFVEQFKAY